VVDIVERVYALMAYGIDTRKHIIIQIIHLQVIDGEKKPGGLTKRIGWYEVGIANSCYPDITK